MLIINKERAKIAHAQHRFEKHGEDDVSAVDLKIEYRVSNDVLAQFSSTLKSSLYYLDESVQGQVIRDANYLPNIKNPKLGAVKWDDKFEDMVFRIHHGEDDDADIVLADAKVSKFLITPLQGGTVVVEFLIQALLGNNSMDAIFHIGRKEIYISLTEEDDEPDQGDMLKEAA